MKIGPDKNIIIYRCVQFFIWVICITLVTVNVYKLLIAYIEWETVQTISTKNPEGEVQLPSFAICPKSNRKFKNTSRIMMTLEEYDDNAYDPNELGVTIKYNDFSVEGVEYKEDYLLTYLRGKCLYYEMKEKVLLQFVNIKSVPLNAVFLRSLTDCGQPLSAIIGALPIL